MMGGTSEAVLAARFDSYQLTVVFLDKALKD